VDTLVDLHAVDWRAAGLEQFGRPTGYLARQLARFAELWRITRTRELPAVDRLTAWLGAHAPESGPSTIVHGDYRLGNVMFADASPARLVAVFDWEMATIGDPLADVGYLFAFWVQPDDPPLRMFELSQATRSGGFPSRAEMVAWYGERSGRSTADIRFYEVLALYKLAVAMEGMFGRAVESGIDNPYLVGFEQGVIELAELGCELAGQRVAGAP
jgi:aminoglycoside phosphotransferase (APT) family kinase protein